VLDTCRRLKEKKSYMVYTAVGCLGVSALSDLVKEVMFLYSPKKIICLLFDQLE
jgi:phosphorylated adapter RNA export protein